MISRGLSSSLVHCVMLNPQGTRDIVVEKCGRGNLLSSWWLKSRETMGRRGKDRVRERATETERQNQRQIYSSDAQL